MDILAKVLISNMKLSQSVRNMALAVTNCAVMKDAGALQLESCWWDSEAPKSP